MTSKSYAVLTVLGCLIVAVISSEKYSTKYENFNVKEVLENRRLLLAYVDCIFGKGKCSPEAKELKENMQEVFETGCDKCTDNQTVITKDVINHLMEHEPAIWKQITDKYDPQGDLLKKYEHRLKAWGVVFKG